MNDFLNNPHDTIYRHVFSDALDAGQMLEDRLPPKPRRRYAWPTLERAPADFVDDLLQEHRSDLLFTVQEAETGLPAYILLEHQSSPDPAMAYRMMKYRMTIWDHIRRDDSRVRSLPAVEPVVFYQGPVRWPYPADSTSVFASDDRSPTATPPMDFVLLDQTLVAPSEVKGSPRGCLVQWAMMAVFRPHQAKEIIDLLAPAARGGGPCSTESVQAPVRQGATRKHIGPYSTEEQRCRTGCMGARMPRDFRHGLPYMASWRDEIDEGGRAPILRYLNFALEDTMRQELRQALRDHGVIKIPEEMRGDGYRILAEGIVKGRLQTIEGLIKAGASWELIESATGMDETRFKELEAAVQNTDIQIP